MYTSKNVGGVAKKLSLRVKQLRTEKMAFLYIFCIFENFSKGKFIKPTPGFVAKLLDSLATAKLSSLAVAT